MANEAIKVRGTPKTVVSSGAAVSATAMSAASASSYGTDADGGGYPDAEIVIDVTFGGAPAAGSSLFLFAQSLDIEGTKDAPAPTAAYQHRRIGVFPLSNLTSQTLDLLAEDVPKLASYYVYNPDSGQTIQVGWTMKIIPVTYKPAP